MSDYVVPKRKVRATVRQVGVPPAEVFIFLGDVAATHRGPELPEDLLNSEDRYLPAVDDDGNLVLFAIEQVVSLFVASDAAAVSDGLSMTDLAAASSIVKDIEVIFAGGGDVLEGTVVYLQPEGRQRLVDFLNIAPPFFTVHTPDGDYVLHGKHIARVRQIDVATESGDDGAMIGQD